jgi:hypothetical protein
MSCFSLLTKIEQSIVLFFQEAAPLSRTYFYRDVAVARRALFEVGTEGEAPRVGL